MREIEGFHNNTTHRSKAALIAIGDPELEVPVPQTMAIKKAKLLSRDSLLNTMIRASLASLQQLVNGEQMTRGQYNEANILVTDMKNKVEREYADIAGQLEITALSGDNMDEDQEAVRNMMKFQVEQGFRIRTIHATLVRKMPTPEPVLRQLIPAGLKAGQDAEGGAGQERQKLKLKPQEVHWLSENLPRLHEVLEGEHKEEEDQHGR